MRTATSAIPRIRSVSDPAPSGESAHDRPSSNGQVGAPGVAAGFGTKNIRWTAACASRNPTKRSLMAIDASRPGAGRARTPPTPSLAGRAGGEAVPNVRESPPDEPVNPERLVPYAVNVNSLVRVTLAAGVETVTSTGPASRPP